MGRWSKGQEVCERYQKRRERNEKRRINIAICEEKKKCYRNARPTNRVDKRETEEK